MGFLETQQENKTTLTEQEEQFIDLIFEGKSKPNAAVEAGYSEKYGYALARKLKDYIVERAKEELATLAPKALDAIKAGLDPEKSLDPVTKVRIETAKDVMDRIGVAKKQEVEVTQKIGIFILPEKKSTTIDITPEE